MNVIPSEVEGSRSFDSPCSLKMKKIIFMNNETKQDHHASREWLHERYAAVISIPLLIWLVINLIRFSRGHYGSFGDFIASPVNATLLMVFIGVFMYYTILAMKVVFEDYISNIKLRDCLIKFMYFAGFAGFILATIAVLKIFFSYQL